MTGTNVIKHILMLSNPTGRDWLEELGVDGRTVLYYIKELDVRM
jgi:hypothetical protein